MAEQFTDENLFELLHEAKSFTDEALEELIHEAGRNSHEFSDFKQKLMDGYRVILEERKYSG